MDPEILSSCNFLSALAWLDILCTTFERYEVSALQFVASRSDISYFVVAVGSLSFVKMRDIWRYHPGIFIIVSTKKRSEDAGPM